MTDTKDEFRFVSLLALELENGDIALPSLPDVVIKVRKLLEDENSDYGQISRAVSMDPALVSRLFVFANSAYYNRANIEIESLETAISRLGIEVVRNTAMSIAMQQLYSADRYSYAHQFLRAVWARGMKLACMAFAVAHCTGNLNNETAFLCGLLNQVGKLYIITKAREFPALLGNRESLENVLCKWHSQIGKSIIETWGFPDEIAESACPASYLGDDPDNPASYVDIVYVAKYLVDNDQEEALELSTDLSCKRLGISDENLADVLLAYREKLKTMQQSLA
ncbi:MAG: HDOD domain-containing protein [Gammaproteobacteria bacterium]|nr:HDOD domain-containing protein [Gammaproteobacteria bacterium]